MTNGAGASFIGQAGSCQNVPYFRTYGEFDMLPHESLKQISGSQLGSMGKTQDIETAGGGRIVVIADSVEFKDIGDRLQANARPYMGYDRKYELAGGSGGYIYVSTTNNNSENSIDPDSTISAVGGYGIQGSFSGSGGVVIFDLNFTLPIE